MRILHLVFAEMPQSDWSDIRASFRYFDVFLHHDRHSRRRTAELLQRPLNHLYEGSKARNERRVTKRNVATRLGQADGLGLIEIYSTLGNQELYILPRVRPLSHALLSRITPYWYQIARGNLYLAGDLVHFEGLD